MTPDVFLADYANPRHARDIVALLDHYARDPMGGGKMPEPTAEDMKAIQDRLAGLGGGQLPGGLPGLPGFPPKKN